MLITFLWLLQFAINFIQKEKDIYIFMTHALSYFVELLATEGLLKNENAVANTKINSCRLRVHGKWESCCSNTAHHGLWTLEQDCYLLDPAVHTCLSLLSPLTWSLLACCFLNLAGHGTTGMGLYLPTTPKGKWLSSIAYVCVHFRV